MYPKKIRIRSCEAIGGIYANIVEESEHGVSSDSDYDPMNGDVYIIGSDRTTKVKVLRKEYVVVEWKKDGQ